MTQHLLARGDHPQVAVSFMRIPVSLCRGMGEAARTIFGSSNTPVWKVAPIGDEMDQIVEDARQAFLNGERFEESTLCGLLQRLTASSDAIALFYGSDTQDLPLAESIDRLYSHLINEFGAAPAELYVQWHKEAHLAVQPKPNGSSEKVPP